MKRFKDYRDDQQQRRRRRLRGLITALPVHGGHSQIGPKREKVDEATGPHGPGYNKDSHWFDHEDNIHVVDHWKKGSHGTPNSDDVHEKLNQDSDSFKKHDKHGAMSDYTKGSKHINKYLIDKASGKKHDYVHHYGDGASDKKYKTEMHKKVQEHIKNLDHALKSSKLKHDVHVYHGLKGWHPGEEAAKNGGKIHLPGYTSTSISKRQAHSFSHADGNGTKHMLHIHLKKGQRAKYLGDNSGFSHEKEMLLPRGITLKIHPRHTVLNGDGKDAEGRHSHKIHVWHATVED